MEKITILSLTVAMAIGFATTSATAHDPQSLEDCAWVDVGYDKSHAHDKNPWCPVDAYIKQFDLDGGNPGSNYPIVGRVLCCTHGHH